MPISFRVYETEYYVVWTHDWRRRIPQACRQCDIRRRLPGVEIWQGGFDLPSCFFHLAHEHLLTRWQISSVQTISGTGANALGALLIAKTMQSKPKVYVGVPTWGNHLDIFQNVDIETVTYQYLNSSKHAVDFSALITAVQTAPPGSIFILQGCCHNPSGVDLSARQWEELASEMRTNCHLPFFDCAYQGLGDGLDEDAAGVRTFVEAGMEMLVCQSFSKNFALYGERCGALHVVADSSEVASNVQDRLRSLIRYTYSSPPAYGSRLVKTVLKDDDLRKAWWVRITTKPQSARLINSLGPWSSAV